MSAAIFGSWLLIAAGYCCWVGDWRATVGCLAGAAGCGLVLWYDVREDT